jgi:Zn-dependent protease
MTIRDTTVVHTEPTPSAGDGSHYRANEQASSGTETPGSARNPSTSGAAPKPRNWGSIATWSAFALLTLSKLKGAIGLVKLLPMGKVLITSLSMLAMIAFESQRSGWLFGVGFVLLILVHELGHGYAMRRHGVAAGWPVFIPFFGAMIAMKGTPRDRDVEAHIAYGGPLAGAGASLLTAGLGLALESRLLLALAYTGFFLNLFNLTPMSPLDGGRIAQAFSRRAWIVGLIILGGMLVVTQTPQLLLIGLLGLGQLFRGGGDADREQLSPQLQRGWAIRYFGLCALLVAGVYLSGRLIGYG